MPQSLSTWVRRNPRLWGLFCAVAAVLLANLLAFVLSEGLGYVRVSMIFLAGVLVAAVLAGAWAAYLTAFLGFFSYNFYLVEPRFTFGIESEDVIILIVFTVTATLTGALAGRLRDARLVAEKRAQDARLLFETGRDLAALEDGRELAERLASALTEVLGVPALVRCEGFESTWSGAQPPQLDTPPPPAGQIRDVGDWRVAGLWAEARPLGLVIWPSPPADSIPAEIEGLLGVLLDMGASAIARAQISRRWAELEAQTRTESLRNALLSSISHDLRTPLASILASATSLKTFGGQFDEGVRADLLDTIEEEAERLNCFVGNLLNMTRLEAGALVLNAVPFDIRESLARLVATYARRAPRRRLDLRIEGDGLVALGDEILFEQAVANVLENALRFGREEGRIELAALRLDESLLVEVADDGPGVPDHEMERIFEKFHRVAGAENVQSGAGLGLSIVRGLVEAMGGTVSARRAGTGGLVVGLHLPRARA